MAAPEGGVGRSPRCGGVSQMIAMKPSVLLLAFCLVLDVNTPAPDFEASDQFGNTIRLSDHLGSWVALWWYPKASTAG